jgi:hypothetical protein
VKPSSHAWLRLQALREAKGKDYNDEGQPKYDGIQPDRKNANKGTERGRYMVEASLRETGAGRSILLDKDGRIIAGNKTFEAASDIGLPVRVVETDGTELVAVKRTDLDLDDDTGTARKLAYYDNRAAQVGLDWDAEQMLADLGAGLDLSAMFRQDELDELLADLQPKGTEGDTPAEVDRAEELRQKWGVKSGDLWRLGDHLLVCGDCTDAATVARVMGGERASTLVSDPPYGIGYKYDTHDDSSNQQNQELIMRAWELGPEAKVWTCGLMNLVRDLAWNPSAKVLCWHKGFAQAGNGLGGASTWEPVLVVGVKGGTLPNDYLHFGTDRIEGLRDLHSCPKPVALFEHLIEHLVGAIVYEPFSGSGTTIIACENLGRRCRAVEISPAYVAVALERWAQATGGTPELVEP